MNTEAYPVVAIVRGNDDDVNAMRAWYKKNFHPILGRLDKL